MSCVKSFTDPFWRLVLDEYEDENVDQRRLMSVSSWFGASRNKRPYGEHSENASYCEERDDDSIESYYENRETVGQKVERAFDRIFNGRRAGAAGADDDEYRPSNTWFGRSNRSYSEERSRGSFMFTPPSPLSTRQGSFMQRRSSFRRQSFRGYDIEDDL